MAISIDNRIINLSHNTKSFYDFFEIQAAINIMDKHA